MSTLFVPCINPVVGAGRPITGVWGSHHNMKNNYHTHPTCNFPQSSVRSHVKDIFPSSKDDISVDLNTNSSINNGQGFSPMFYDSGTQNLKQNLHSPPATDSGYNSPITSPIGLNPQQTNIWSPTSVPSAIPEDEAMQDDSDSDDDVTLTLNSALHPNKFPVQIEYHDNKFCTYRRQGTRSGEKTLIKHMKTFNPATGLPLIEVQKMKSYQKHLVRICRCGKYEVMDGALQQGRTNDCNGYEIHYNQKCRWKAYDDMVTGKRVLIRLCKCYKPPKN